MPTRIDTYFRLEPRPRDRDMENGFAARIHDPLWLLARQWQMGEHQGENASSPVRVTCAVTTTPIEKINGNDALDPAIVPPEALVESEVDDWWTMGRRVRVGKLLSGRPAVMNAQGVRFRDPPPPYEEFRGQVDGRAVWNARIDLNLPVTVFGADAPPDESPFNWNSRKLNYGTRFETSDRPLLVRDHHGGPMDWYSADGGESVPPGAAPEPPTIECIPTPLEYPGAPHSRFWEIEDAHVDIGGYPPDSAHFATMLLVDLVYSHGDDWFLFPITANSGNIVTIRSLSVTDSFGKKYSSDDLDNNTIKYPGLRAPSDFTLFKCQGLNDASLVLWPVAESPLESGPLERVQFGVDEHSNLLWALERIIDGRQADRLPGEANPDHPKYPAPKPIGDTTKAKSYVYVPAVGIESRWHPYKQDADGLFYIQHGLADYSQQFPRPMPHPDAEVLKAGTRTTPAPHEIDAAVLPTGGVELERRWQLARDMKGRPVLWIQRQRRVLRTPPARTIRFDVAEESEI